MPSTYTQLLYHFIFATKHRQPLISNLWRCRLHEYLCGTITGLGGNPFAVGGVSDHVHILAGLKATHCVADFVRELKKASSHWVKADIRSNDFAWQEGYSAFSVSASARDSVRNYIERQEEHHKRRTFREEWIEFLQKSGIEFDERYFD